MNQLEKNPVFLTHYPPEAIRYPKKAFTDFAGVSHPALFRDRSALNRIAGDIPRLLEDFDKAVQLGWIQTSVIAWKGKKLDTGEIQVSYNIVGASRYAQVKSNLVYALIGYQNDPELIQKLGCKVNNDFGEVEYDPLINRAATPWGNDARLYVIGASARNSADRNQEVIPAMLGTVPKMILSDIIASYR